MGKSYLVLDASNSHIVVGVFGNGISYSKTRFAPRESFQLITPAIQQALSETNVSRPDAIVCAVGPGSFTGIRIGVSAARNLAQLWGIPAIGINSLSFYAFQIRMQETEPFAICIDGKQKRYYTKFIVDRASDSIERVDTFDLASAEIQERLHRLQIHQVYCNDPATLRIHNVQVRETPEPDAHVLFQAAMTLNVSEGSWSDLLPHYHRKDPAEQKHPEGIRKI
ncbi:MAG: tRNA (adenosine(37)-N6)-threonylcarbamoyltransferase complex dimerization subunit type 1 TsaB [Leptospirales bacterium]|nr:tRNA (adenosine(37)-N6)-threonylcarbamoyltransferase complex dimerization subunit type 1 TsaB [Leptospirales bacterium]